MPSLTSQQLSQYARQLKLDEIGTEGQLRLSNARLLCIGAGGLGCGALPYLAAAGIGKIDIIDHDTVEISNLHRQVLYTHDDLGKKKAAVAKQQISRLNPLITISAFDEPLTEKNALSLIGNYDIVLDCTDNFATRFLINDACAHHKIPYVYASIEKFRGQVSIFCAPDSPCYRCWYDNPPPAGNSPNCADAGVLGVLPGLLGVIQASEAIKCLLGIGTPLIGQILSIDALTMQFQKRQLACNPACKLCAQQQSFNTLSRSATTQKDELPSITADALKPLLAANDVFLLDVREPAEFAAKNLNGYLIPLGELPLRMNELPTDKSIVVHCRSGGRSANAVQLLQQAGFVKVYNLTGGILAWQ